MNHKRPKKLDENFKKDVNKLKALIASSGSTEDRRLVRLWLEKLQESTAERKLRNKFLEVLIRQIKVNGKLSRPFNFHPPSMSLWQCSEGNPEFKPDSSDDESVSTSSTEKHGSEAGDFDESLEKGNQPDQVTKYKSIFTSLQPPDKFKNLTNTVSFLKAQNDALLHEVSLYQSASRRNEKKMEAVSREVDDLKLKLIDLQKINKFIETSHAEVIKDYKRALADASSELTDRLEALVKRNLAIEKSLDEMKHTMKPPSPLRMKAQVELMALAKRLSTELEIESAKHKTEVDTLKKVLADKEYQLARLDARLHRYCTKMKEESMNIKKSLYNTEEESHWSKPKDFKNVQKAEDMSRMIRTPERTRELVNRINDIDQRYKSMIQEMEKKHADECAKQQEVIEELEDKVYGLQTKTTMRS